MHTEPSVVLFLVDGMRPDALQQASTPQMDAMIAKGSHTLEARSVMPSITLPCVASMLLGCDPSRHGVHTNAWDQIDRPIPSVFDVIHAAGLPAMAFYNWENLRDLSAPGSLSASFYVRSAWEEDGDTKLAALAATLMTQRPWRFAFVYLGCTDAAGHRHGFMSAPYIAAVEKADRAIRCVIDALATAGLDNDATYIVGADHGGHDTGHGEDIPEDMTVPWIAFGRGIASGRRLSEPVSIVDTGPTIVRLLGLTAPEQWTGRCLDLT